MDKKIIPASHFAEQLKLDKSSNLERFYEAYREFMKHKHDSYTAEEIESRIKDMKAEYSV